MSNETKNKNNEQTMVPQLWGMVKTHDNVKSVFINPDTGNQVEAFEKVPRGILPVNDDTWMDPEYFMKILGPCVGRNFRQTPNGSQIRDLFFANVQGGAKPGGGRYAWLKWGELWSGENQDKETGEMKQWTAVKVGLVPWKRPEAPLLPQDTADKVKAIEDAIDAL